MRHIYLPYNEKLKSKARYLRNNPTAAENKLWHYHLRNHKYIFLRQKPINNFIVDFYCSKLQLVIEIDGDSHLGEENILYDKERTKILEQYGLKILRFWNDDVLNGIEIVSEMIDDEINKLTPPLLKGGWGDFFKLSNPPLSPFFKGDFFSAPPLVKGGLGILFLHQGFFN